MIWINFWRKINGKDSLQASTSGTPKASTVGGTLTRNLTGKHLTETWLQSTVVTNLNSSNYKGICVFDGSGWVYLRTPTQILSDIETGGVDIQTSSTQPTNQKSGDFWYQIV